MITFPDSTPVSSQGMSEEFEDSIPVSSQGISENDQFLDSIQTLLLIQFRCDPDMDDILTLIHTQYG